MYSLLQVVSPVDGTVVVQDPDQRMTFFALDQLYVGEVGSGKYAGKVGDIVIDRSIPTKLRFYFISAIDDKLIPTLIPTNIFEDKITNELNNFIGVGPGQFNNNLRMYIDKRTWPYTCQIDRRLALPGSNNTYARIYLSSLTENKKECISRIYDQNGNFLNDAVPLEFASDPKYGNDALKTVGTFKTTYDLKDNELLTVVVFSDEGIVTTIMPILVMNTSFISTPDLSKRYIKDISLVCAYINSENPNLIEYPVNTPLSAMNFACRVEYNDGTAMFPVDGTKASISGLESFIATIPGQEIPDITLHYYLSSDEYNYTMRKSSVDHISRSYKAKIVDQDDSIIVKMFVIPVYIDAVNGYRLTYILYSMSRQQYWDVTRIVRHADNGATFDPTAYGTLQRLVLVLDLEKVDYSLKEYRFVQSIDLVLNQPTHHSPFMISYESGQKLPTGAGIYAEYRFLASGYSELKLNCHAVSVDDWLDKLYYNSKPLVNNLIEGLPPRPTHFEIQIDEYTAQYKVETDWNKIIVIGKSLTNYSTLVVRFYTETIDTELQLSTIGILIKDANTIPFYSDLVEG